MDKLLTVEYDKSGGEVDIHLNDVGIDFLITALTSMKHWQTNDHAHLMTTVWGGKELTNERQSCDDSVELINHLKIFYWKEK